MFPRQLRVSCREFVPARPAPPRLPISVPGSVGVSTVGDQVVIVALALYITQRTGSATDLGLVLAAQTLPLVALILFGGVWADRLARQRIMIAADLARAGLHASLAALIFTGGASVVEMVVIEALFGAARAFFKPAYTGPAPADHARGADPGSARPDRVDRQRGRPGRPGAGHRAGAERRRRRGVRARCRDLPAAARRCWCACIPAPAGPSAEAARRSCTTLRAGWREVAIAPLGVGDDRRVLPARCCAATPSGTRWRRRSPRTFYGHAGRVRRARERRGCRRGDRRRGGHPRGGRRGRCWPGLLLILPWPLQDIAFALGAPFGMVVALAFSRRIWLLAVR